MFFFCVSEARMRDDLKPILLIKEYFKSFLIKTLNFCSFHCHCPHFEEYEMRRSKGVLLVSPDFLCHFYYF